MSPAPHLAPSTPETPWDYGALVAIGARMRPWAPCPESAALLLAVMVAACDDLSWHLHRAPAEMPTWPAGTRAGRDTLAEVVDFLNGARLGVFCDVLASGEPAGSFQPQARPRAFMGALGDGMDLRCTGEDSRIAPPTPEAIRRGLASSLNLRLHGPRELLCLPDAYVDAIESMGVEVAA